MLKSTSTKISDTGINLIKKYEGLRLKAYLPTKNDVPTIGYGHTKGVKMGDTITEKEAVKFLKEDLKWVEDAINRNVKVPLTQNQFDALASWVYNLGESNLKSSTLLRVLNNGQYDEVPNQMKRWTRQKGKILKGLVRRRAEEAALWSK